MLKCGIFCFLLIVLCNSYSYGQSIDKNDYVEYDVISEEEHFEINYRFKDQFNNFQTYRITLPKHETSRMIDKFGIPRWLFEPYPDSDANRIIREAEINKGLFQLNGNVIEVDKNAVISYYGKTFSRPIAKMIVSSLADYGCDNRRNRIEFTMRFIQDIPYGVPQYQDSERHFGGVHVPPQLLIKGYGDCDSKALLFVSILSYLIPPDDIVFLNQEDHVLSAVKGNTEDGLTYIQFEENEFLIAETSGPGKRMLGQMGSYFREEYLVETLTIAPPDILPINKSRPSTSHPVLQQQIEDNILVLTNESSINFQFQISSDKRNWETLALHANQSGRYIYNSRTSVFLRLIINERKTLTYQVDTGNSYLVYWNNKKKRWEISTT